MFEKHQSRAEYGEPGDPCSDDTRDRERGWIERPLRGDGDDEAGDSGESEGDEGLRVTPHSGSSKRESILHPPIVPLSEIHCSTNRHNEAACEPFTLEPR